MRTSFIMVNLLCATLGVTALEQSARAQSCAQVLGQYQAPQGQTLATSLEGSGPWAVYAAGAVTGGTITFEKEGVAGVVDFCALCGPSSAAISSSVSNADQDTVTVSNTIGLSAEISAEVGNAAIGKLGLKEGIKFDATNSTSASATETLMHSVTVTRSGSQTNRYIAKVNTQIWGMHGRKTSVAVGRFSKVYKVRYYNPSNNQYTDASPLWASCDPEWKDILVDNPKACRSFPQYRVTQPDEQCTTAPPACAGSGATGMPPPTGTATTPPPTSGSGS